MANMGQAKHASQCCRWPTREALEAQLRVARRMVATMRDRAEHFASGIFPAFRRHPVRAVAAGMTAGAAGGGAIGLAAGLFLRSRHHGA
jgi:hypothetical protein